MTLSEMRSEVWEDVGEPTQLDPATVAGAARLNRWINKAYKKVLMWRFPDGTLLRFPCMDGELFFKTVTVTGSVVAADTETVTLDSSAGSGDDQYKGWILDAGGGAREIVDYDGPSRIATVHTVYGTAPTVGATYTMYKRWMRLCESGGVGASENIVLSPLAQFLAPKKVTDIERFIDLTPALRHDAFSLTVLASGIPRQYMMLGNDLVFDYPVDEERWYRMEYARMPPDLVADSDVPEIPPYWDEAILLWAEARAHRWQQDFSASYALKKDLEQFMAESKQQAELQYEREAGQAEVDLQ